MKKILFTMICYRSSSGAMHANAIELKETTYAVTASFESLRNSSSNNQKSYFDTASASVIYHKKNSPFTFELSGNNIFDTKTNNSYYFSDYMVSERSIYIMPRIVLIGISYKL